jgi:peptidoglycan glycosyltransferase
MTDFTREINRLLFGLLLALLLVTIAAAYWGMSGTEGILQREDNPRLVEDEAAIRRGSIYDRNDILLVQSVLTDTGQLKRDYLYPETYSALGYFSLRYGTGGAEAAYDALLRGDTLPIDWNTIFERDFLHRPQAGSDIRLTLDIEVQRELVAAMGTHKGASVILSVPQGEVLALVSLPTYNPNTLDANWEALIKAPGNPFFNRVLQGQYQPGGLLQTPLIATLLLRDSSLATLTADANQPIMLAQTRLTCAVEPLQNDLTFTQAYAYGCPRPFALLAAQMDEATTQNIFEAFRLAQPLTLPGFVAQLPQVTSPEATPDIIPEANDNSLLAQALGQGTQTVNPLSMAAIAAAMLNAGNMPIPSALIASRPPTATDWQPLATLGSSTPILAEPVAHQLRDLMLANVQQGAAEKAHIANINIGGHSALSYSGEGIQAWFIGFVVLDNGQGAAIAIILEDTNDVNKAASIGGNALWAAYRALYTPSQ